MVAVASDVAGMRSIKTIWYFWYISHLIFIETKGLLRLPYIFQLELCYFPSMTLNLNQLPAAKNDNKQTFGSSYFVWTLLTHWLYRFLEGEKTSRF